MPKKQTVLVVEDEKLLRRPLCKTLEFHGYATLEADSGTTALEIWAAQKDSIDLLLTDLMMPGNIDGYELAQKLQSEKPALKIIFSTGQKSVLTKKRLVLTDGINLLEKPYDAQKLISAIRSNLEQS